jgi:hypothetical protein|eukprot:COSAG01_NODE_15606_length_1320_cov_1.220311_2_plen_143_part_00
MISPSCVRSPALRLAFVAGSASQAQAQAETAPAAPEVVCCRAPLFASAVQQVVAAAGSGEGSGPSSRTSVTLRQSELCAQAVVAGYGFVLARALRRGGGSGESFLRVHWVAVPEALRARRVNRRRHRWAGGCAQRSGGVGCH